MFLLKRIRTTSKQIKHLPKVLTCHISNNFSNTNQEHLKLDIKGQELLFPYVWLRDNCQCEKCFHYSAKSRILDWSYFDPNIKPKEVRKDENSLEITWPDGHKSQYQYDWLKFRSFTKENQDDYREAIYRPKKVIWDGKDFDRVCSRHKFDEILNSERALYNWLHKISVYGVALIENTPNIDNALDELIAKIGFIKPTHYGLKFVVKNVQDTSNVAYLSSKLQMHVDLPYYEYCPGVNMLHCLSQSSQGGDNLLSDGHFVANYMKEHHPEDYKLLTNIEVEWSDVGVENGNEFFKLHRSPVIFLNNYGEITRINFSIPQRGSHFPGPIDKVVPWYRAHTLFFHLSEKFSATFKSKAGNILVFDNIRLLHGRAEYEDKTGIVRKLVGGYVDWDEIYSRLRCLRIKLDNNEGIL